MRLAWALPVLVVFISSCAGSDTAEYSPPWMSHDDPAAVRSEQLYQARRNALDDISGAEESLHHMQGLSQSDLSKRQQDLNEARSQVLSGNWTPTTY